MARTFNTTPEKYKYPAYDADYVYIPGTWYHIWAKTSKPKQRKTVDYEWHWMGTPGWWIRCMMTKPQRRAVSIWERKAVTSNDLEEVDTPPHGRKPHVYYW